MMRAAPVLLALLIAPAGWAQPVGTPSAERPPARPATTEGALPQGGEVPGEARPPGPPAPQGRLIAPVAPEEHDADPAAEPAPSGPPQREVLRETDADFSACLLALHVAGARYETGGEITGEHRDCGIARPVTLVEALPGVVLEGAPPMRCDTARALSWWLRDHVLPAASRLPGAPRPVALALGTTYQCRGVVGGSGEGAELSEHAFGNAVDIAAIRFDSGDSLTPSQAAGPDLPAGFVAAIRGAACLYFTTVLGPGSNAAHEDHLHLDVKARRGGYRICQ